MSVGNSDRSNAGEGNVATVESQGFNAQDGGAPGAALPFLIGTAVGVSAGVVAGALFARYGVHLVAATIGLLDRRSGRDDGDRPRFELLLQ